MVLRFSENHDSLERDAVPRHETGLAAAISEPQEGSATIGKVSAEQLASSRLSVTPCMTNTKHVSLSMSDMSVCPMSWYFCLSMLISSEALRSLRWVKLFHGGEFASESA